MALSASAIFETVRVRRLSNIAWINTFCQAAPYGGVLNVCMVHPSAITLKRDFAPRLMDSDQIGRYGKFSPWPPAASIRVSSEKWLH